MKLYFIEQSERRGWDTYDSAVIAADSPEIAKRTHPSGDDRNWGSNYGTWCSSPNNVTVTYIGEADSSVESGVVIASFNAG